MVAHPPYNPVITSRTNPLVKDFMALRRSARLRAARKLTEEEVRA